eukprot:4696773-Karenia_brevis.AAC.1
MARVVGSGSVYSAGMGPGGGRSVSSPPSLGATSYPAANNMSPRLMRPCGPASHSSGCSLRLQSLLGLLALC